MIYLINLIAAAIQSRDEQMKILSPVMQHIVTLPMACCLRESILVIRKLHYQLSRILRTLSCCTCFISQPLVSDRIETSSLRYDCIFLVSSRAIMSTSLVDSLRPELLPSVVVNNINTISVNSISVLVQSFVGMI